MRDEFKDPKIGDEVAYHNSRDPDPVKRAITKVLATQIEIEGGIRFMRSTGRLFGRGTYDHSRIEPWTPEVERAITKRIASVALAERRKRVLERLSKVTAPVEWMPNPSTHLLGDPRRETLVRRPLSNRQLDMIETLTVELERIVAEAVAALTPPAAPALTIAA
jgi:hypothetical protein